MLPIKQTITKLQKSLNKRTIFFSGLIIIFSVFIFNLALGLQTMLAQGNVQSYSNTLVHKSDSKLPWSTADWASNSGEDQTNNFQRLQYQYNQNNSQKQSASTISSSSYRSSQSSQANSSAESNNDATNNQQTLILGRGANPIEQDIATIEQKTGTKVQSIESLTQDIVQLNLDKPANRDIVKEIQDQTNIKVDNNDEIFLQQFDDNLVDEDPNLLSNSSDQSQPSSNSQSDSSSSINSADNKSISSLAPTSNSNSLGLLANSSSSTSSSKANIASTTNDINPLNISIPNDPLKTVQWYLNNQGSPFVENGNTRTPTQGFDIRANAGWQNTVGSPIITSQSQTSKKDIVVAVIDGGVDITHPDLKNNIYRDAQGDVIGWNFYNYNCPTLVLTPPITSGPTSAIGIAAQTSSSSTNTPKCSLGDPIQETDILDVGYGHGTHVAGTIAAEANKIGITGACPECKIMPLKFLGGPKSGGTIANAVRAINFAIANGADVINISWGGATLYTNLKDEIDKATLKNVTVVGAAGNNNADSILYPAAFPSVISVSALGINGKKAGFSNYNSLVDITAPGESILSTVPKGSTICSDASFGLPDDGYGFCSGTSMAAPIIAGSAGLYKSLFPNAKPNQVLKALQESTSDVYDANPEFNLNNTPKLGTGMVDLDKLLSTKTSQ
jgi:subtilisin family serine protease